VPANYLEEVGFWGNNRKESCLTVFFYFLLL
jgi:hypothetical protein